MPIQAAEEIISTQPWIWSNRLLWSVIAMFILGSMARTFVSNEPFDVKKFLGEVIFSTIAAIMLYSMGMMQGMTPEQIICFGSLGSLGGVRVVEWILKIARKAKDSGVLDE